MASNLSERLKVTVDPATKAALVARAEQDYRSVAAVVRAAIRSYLQKGQR